MSDSTADIDIAVKLRVRMSVPAVVAARMTKQDLADTILATLPLSGTAELVVNAAPASEVIGEVEIEIVPWFDPLPADEIEVTDFAPDEWPLVPPTG